MSTLDQPGAVSGDVAIAPTPFGVSVRKWNSLKTSALRAAGFAITAVAWMNIVLMLVYIFHGYRIDFHSDSATKNLLAEEILRTGELFPRDWYFVNSDIWLVFNHLLIVPLLSFMDNGYAAHAVAGAIWAVLILLCTWLLSGLLTNVRPVRMALVALVAGGVSWAGAENIFGQVAYGNTFMLSGLAIYASWRYLCGTGRQATVFGVLAGLLMLLTFASNPQRAVISYLLPLCAAVSIHGARDLWASGWRIGMPVRRSLVLISLLVAGGLLGVAWHHWLLARVLDVPGAGNARWLDFGTMLTNAGATLHGLFGLLGGVPTPGASLTSMGGVYQGVRLIVASLLVVFVPLALVRALKNGAPAVRYVGVFSLVSLGLFLFLQVTTTIPQMVDPIGSARYLMPPLLMGLMLLGASVVAPDFGGFKRCIAAALIAALILGSVGPGNPLSRLFKDPVAEPFAETVEMLRREGLSYGYASYWNAGVHSVMSDGDVRVRAIYIVGALPIPMRHLSSEFWYSPKAWNGETFLLLEAHEAAAIDWAQMERYLGAPVRQFQFERFQIYVYKQNPALVLPGWPQSAAGIVLGSESPRTVGSFDASGASSRLVAEPGDEGYLHFGPYINMAAGRYTARFDLSLAQPGALEDAEVVILDVVSQKGHVVHARRSLTGEASGGSVELEFELPRKVDDLEARVLTTGRARVELSSIRLERAD